MVTVQNDSYGLFRTSCSHNPPQYSQSVGPLPRFLLILERAIKPFSTYVQARHGKRLFALESYVPVFAAFLTCRALCSYLQDKRRPLAEDKVPGQVRQDVKHLGNTQSQGAGRAVNCNLRC